MTHAARVAAGDPTPAPIGATFDHVSRFVWHCHFLDHEDNGMTRPWMCVS